MQACEHLTCSITLHGLGEPRGLQVGAPGGDGSCCGPEHQCPGDLVRAQDGGLRAWVWPLTVPCDQVPRRCWCCRFALDGRRRGSCLSPRAVGGGLASRRAGGAGFEKGTGEAGGRGIRPRGLEWRSEQDGKTSEERGGAGAVK